mgnify:CR=1 FL=1
MHEARDRLAAKLDQVLEEHAADGTAVAVALVEHPGAEPLTRGRPANNTQEPRFLIYSITKTFTSALFLLLQESGELTLDDPLARRLPQVPRADRITLRRLLDHTAGIPDYGGLAAYHQAVRETPSRAWTFERYAAETVDKGPLFEPGEGWAYSNPGYMLLRRIPERVTGLPYARTIDELIVKPLGLGSTKLAEGPADLTGLAPATSAALSLDGSPRDVRQHYDPGWVSHGVLASSAADVARFLSALFTGRLLSPASVTAMTSLTRVPVPGSQSDPQVRPYEWREPSYGLGLMADPAAPWGPIYGHNGGGPGYSASVFHAPDLGGATVAAIGSETEGFDAEQVVFDVFDALSVTMRT